MFSLGQAVNRNAWIEEPKGVKEIGAPADLDDGKMHHVQVAGNDIVLVSDSDGLHAFGGVCSHAGCSLWDSALDGHVVTCDCHGSQFDITDGSLVHGPATVGVPSYTVTRQGEKLYIRARE